MSTTTAAPAGKIQPRLKQKYRSRDPAAAAGRVRLRQRQPDPRHRQGRRQHRCRRGSSRQQGDRWCGRRPHQDHRPEAGRHEGPQVDRAVQAARGPGHRRARHPPRRPRVGVPGPSRRRSRCPASATSAACRRSSSTATATTRSVCRSSRSSTRSTRTRSTASAASTSPSSRRRRRMTRAARCCAPRLPVPQRRRPGVITTSRSRLGTGTTTGRLSCNGSRNLMNKGNNT